MEVIPHGFLKEGKKKMGCHTIVVKKVNWNIRIIMYVYMQFNQPIANLYIIKKVQILHVFFKKGGIFKVKFSTFLPQKGG